MPIFESRGGTRVGVPLVTIAAGAGMIGVGAAVSMSGTNATFVQQFASTTLAMGATPYTSAIGGLMISVVGGAILIGSGVLGLIANFLNFRRFFIATVLLNILGAIVVLAGGIMFSTFNGLSDVDKTAVPNANKVTLSSPYNLYHMWGLAVFEACCYDAGNYKQEKIASCGTNYCPALTDERILQYKSLVDLTKLCTCIEDTTVYNKGLAKIKETGMCSTLEKTKVIFDPNLNIPTTSLSLNLVLSQQYPGLEVKSMPIVGFWNAPTFGCQLGYWKGPIWFTSLYIKQEFSIVATLSFVFAAIAFLGNVAGVVISYASHAQSGEQHQLLKEAELGTSMAAIGSFPTIAVPSAYSQSDIESRLKDFYAKYDPTKTPADVKNVAAWAIKNGLPTLNAKLREKYHADLGIN